MEKEANQDSEKTNDSVQATVTSEQPVNNPPQESKRGGKKKSPEFLVVGIGASAGGIVALQQFFAHLPVSIEADNQPAESTNLAFVVVTHLSPTHESNLAAIIQNQTALTVIQVTEPVQVKPDMVYVIPPGKQLEMVDGYIEVTDLEETRSLRAPIDLFFRTLSEAHPYSTAAIVLSGSGSDGSVGLPRVKEMGGLTLAQLPNEAEYNQMPNNAIATGYVDQVLPVAGMGQWLLEFNKNRQKIDLHTSPTVKAEKDQELEAEDADQDDRSEENAKDAGRDGSKDILLEILAFLRVRTGHNFALYKRATLNRRLERRLQINNIVSLLTYLDFLGNNPNEVKALLRDFLISVTNFFRDKPVWDYLETDVIPLLFQGKEGVASTVRVWVAGCASGEEAYSMAILLHEYASRLVLPPQVQVFASDLDEHAISVAREGSYPDTIGLDVSAERLERFFTQHGRRYRINKELRDTILFAPHDLLKDPPFSRLDLISCRNLLIYLNRDAQKQLLSVYHFALKPNGFLLLGTSESAEGVSQFFSSTDKKAHLYQSRAITPVPIIQQPLVLPVRNRGTLDLQLPNLPLSLNREKIVFAEDLQQQINGLYSQAGVMVDENFNIIHLSNRAGRYLQFSGGEFTNNLLRLVHPDLRFELHGKLYQSNQYGKTLKSRWINLNLGGSNLLVRLLVRPIAEPAALRGYTLVIFDEEEIDESEENLPEGHQQEAFTLSPDARRDVEAFTRQLENEIGLLKNQLQNTIEQHNTSIEELKASNEELQAINEEFRSATEELETSKEELQAVNEELMTVNQELKIKINEVGHANSDLQNLMFSTDIATIFLDRKLHIKRYTPRVERFFNVIPTDIHRPLSHLTHRLDYTNLAVDSELVLRDLVPVSREIKTLDDEWYLVRVLPYRTLEDHIDGIVITFTDITERKKAELDLYAQHTLLEIAMEATNAGWGNWDWRTGETEWSENARRVLGFEKAEEARSSKFWLQHIHSEDRSEIEANLNRAAAEHRDFHLEYRVVHSNGAIRYILGAGHIFYGEDNQPIRSTGMVVDITERRQAEASLRTSEENYRTLFESIDEGYGLCEIIYDENGRAVDWLLLEVNRAFELATGLAKTAGKTALALNPETEDYWPATLDKVIKTGEALRFELYTKGLDRWFDVYASPVNGENSHRVAVVFSDITRRKKSVEALRESENRFRAVAELVPDLLWSTDPSGVPRWFNRRWQEYTGQSLEQAVNTGLLQSIQPEDREQLQFNFQEAISKGQNLRQELRLQGADGTYRWFLVQITPIWDEEEPPQAQVTMPNQSKIIRWYAAATNIHEQREALDKLEKRVNDRTGELADKNTQLTEANTRLSDLNTQLDKERTRLRQLSNQLLETQESERRYLARELHDEIGQYLTGLKFLLDTWVRVPSDKKAAQVGEMVSTLEKLTLRVSDLSLNLRPTMLDDLGLLPALTSLIQRYTSQTQIKVDFFQKGLEGRLPTQIETTAYRMVQEALTNVARHGKTNRLLVQIVLEDNLNVLIQDEGQGFNLEEVQALYTSTGLSAMRERVELVGGQLTIETEPGTGTTIIAQIPIEPEFEAKS